MWVRKEKLLPPPCRVVSPGRLECEALSLRLKNQSSLRPVQHTSKGDSGTSPVGRGFRPLRRLGSRAPLSHSDRVPTTPSRAAQGAGRPSHGHRPRLGAHAQRRPRAVLSADFRSDVFSWLNKARGLCIPRKLPTELFTKPVCLLGTPSFHVPFVSGRLDVCGASWWLSRSGRTSKCFFHF